MTETEIKALYDGFEKKNMPFAQFRRELKDVMDPDKMVSDLSEVQLQRAREQMNRMRINKRLN